MSELIGILFGLVSASFGYTFVIHRKLERKVNKEDFCRIESRIDEIYKILINLTTQISNH